MVLLSIEAINVYLPINNTLKKKKCFIRLIALQLCAVFKIFLTVKEGPFLHFPLHRHSF